MITFHIVLVVSPVFSYEYMFSFIWSFLLQIIHGTTSQGFSKQKSNLRRLSWTEVKWENCLEWKEKHHLTRNHQPSSLRL